MTEKELEQVRVLAGNYLQSYRNWREGQAYFNALHELHPDRANLIRGTEYDMFYLKENIKAFEEMIKSN